MGSELHEYRLEDCMDAIIDYRGKTPTKTDSGIPLITAKIIKNGQIQEVSEFIAESDYDSWMTRGIPKEGDVVLTTEAPLGEVAQLDSRKVALAQRVITLRGKQGLLDNDYLLYLLQSHDIQNQLDGRASGSTVTGIKQSELREIILRFPFIDIQKKIAAHLKAIDQKITLNHQINQTLEQMAQTLFKSWFVDFDPVIDNALDAGNEIPDTLQERAEQRRLLRAKADFKSLPAETRALFPSEFEETELGWVPKGWTVRPAEEIADISIGKTPPRAETHWFSENASQNIPWVSIKDMGTCGVFTNGSSEYLVPEGVSKFNVKLVPKDSIILSFKLTLGRVSIASECLTTNEAIAHFVNLKFGLSKEFIYCYLRAFNFDLLGSTSSIATAINSKIIKMMPFLVPNFDVTKYYTESVGSIFEKIKMASDEINVLIQLRDSLLPKLISGELALDALPEVPELAEAF